MKTLKHKKIKTKDEQHDNECSSMEMKPVPLLMIIVGILMRLVPHPPNVAPITAMALFGGVYLPKRYAFILPITALLLSDLIIGFYGAGMLFVYGSFVLIGVVGLWLKDKKSVPAVAGVSLFSSVLFYLVTNFGVWLTTTMYTKDISGLMDSYIMALPFFRSTLAGDLLYTGLFFGAYELARYLAKQYLPKKYFNLAF